MGFDWSWVLVIAGAVAILIEVAMGGFAGFDLVLIGSAFVLGGACGLLLGSPIAGFASAGALCLLYIAAGRRWLRDRLLHKTVHSNADAVIGRQALVTQRVGPHQPGQVKTGDEIWRALPAPGTAGPFEPGAVVTVDAVDGVTLLVR